MKTRPHDEKLAIRVIAMPRDTNPSGDMFGGWLLSLMDMAAGNVANHRVKGRVVTAAIDAISFHEPVFVGDDVSCYAEIISIGNTSMKIQVDVWARRRCTSEDVHVTEGAFTFVALDENRRPRPIEK